MSENLLERQLVAAVRFARQGDKAKARPLLEEILKQERTNEQAWIWLASVVDSPKERRVCIEKVLKINPKNAPAQAALNTMVGVLGAGEQPKIDYEAISKAAVKPLPITGTRKEAPAPPRNLAGGGGGLRSRMPLLIGAAVVLGILLLLTLVPDLGIFTDVPTTTPTEAVEITEEPSPTVDPLYTPPSPTIAPTATFSGTFVAVTRAVELPATFTPTVTATPTNTPTATATLPSLVAYNWLFVATQGTSLPVIYSINGNEQGLNLLLANVEEFDYDITTGLLAIVEPNQVTTESGTIEIVYRLFVVPIGALDQRTEITSASMPNAISPAFSPDGTKLAFAGDANGDYEIYIYDIGNRSLRQVTNNNFDDIDPDWSPVGTNIIYASDFGTPGSFDLYNISATDVNAEESRMRVTDLNTNNTNPAWSPTSAMVAFTSQSGSNTKIVLSDVNASFFRDLTFISSLNYSEPAWTPDGLYVVFTSGAEGDEHTVHLIPANGGPELQFRLNGLAVRRIVPR